MDFGLIKYLHKKYDKSISKESIARKLDITERHLNNCIKSRQELPQPKKLALSKIFGGVVEKRQSLPPS